MNEQSNEEIGVGGEKGDKEGGGKKMERIKGGLQGRREEMGGEDIRGHAGGVN